MAFASFSGSLPSSSKSGASLADEASALRESAPAGRRGDNATHAMETRTGAKRAARRMGRMAGGILSHRWYVSPMRSPVIAATLLLACSSATPVAVAPDTARASRDVAAVLDDCHDAAANADEARYFGHFAPEGVFLGTDASERWDVAAFRAYAHPR